MAGKIPRDRNWEGHGKIGCSRQSADCRRCRRSTPYCPNRYAPTPSLSLDRPTMTMLSSADATERADFPTMTLPLLRCRRDRDDLSAIDDPEWSHIHEMLVDNMIPLDKALRPFVQKLPARGEWLTFVWHLARVHQWRRIQPESSWRWRAIWLGERWIEALVTRVPGRLSTYYKFRRILSGDSR